MSCWRTNPRRSPHTARRLNDAVAPSLGPDESAFLGLEDNREALLWRLAMIDAATTSIDAQYFIWTDDEVGNLLFARCLAAADRGDEGLDLRLALVREEFLLHFQPMIDIDCHDVVAAEALIRWQHPSRGLVPPVDLQALHREAFQVGQRRITGAKIIDRDFYT